MRGFHYETIRTLRNTLNEQPFPETLLLLWERMTSYFDIFDVTFSRVLCAVTKVMVNFSPGVRPNYSNHNTIRSN